MMKKAIVLFTIILSMAVGSQAQTKQEIEVTNAVEKLRLAMISGLKPDLDAIATDDLTYCHSSGKVQNKTEFMDSFITKASVFKSIIFTDQIVKITGNTAIVHHILSGVTADGGVPGTVKLGIMLVFIKQHGEWKLLARQAFKLPA